MIFFFEALITFLVVMAAYYIFSDVIWAKIKFIFEKLDELKLEVNKRFKKE